MLHIDYYVYIAILILAIIIFLFLIRIIIVVRSEIKEQEAPIELLNAKIIELEKQNLDLQIKKQKIHNEFE